jgi:Flp pilus assembly protein TadG
MRKHGVLTKEAGSAPVESIFAIVLLMMLALGTIQIALALYGRNLVAAAAHDAARAGIELGSSTSEAEGIAASVVETAGGRLVRGLRVQVDADKDERVRTVRVRITGTIDVLGPLPIPVPVDARASATTEGVVE